MSDTIQARINPLSWLDVEIAENSGQKIAPTFESLAAFLSSPNMPLSIDTAIQRYRSATSSQTNVFVVPEHPEILEKLVWPLRAAKSSYVSGNLISTIAQCGMVAEMVALLWFEIADLHVNDAAMDRTGEKQLFGQPFESLGQERRVEILVGFGIIGNEQNAHFSNVRKLRRRYLHFFSQKHNNIENDALSVLNSAVALVANLIDLTVVDGQVGMRPALLKYVEERDKT